MQFLSGGSVEKIAVIGGGLFLWDLLKGKKQKESPNLDKATAELWAIARRGRIGLVPELPPEVSRDDRLIQALSDVRESLPKEEDQAEFDSIVILFDCVIRSVSPEIKDEVIHTLCCLTVGYSDMSKARTNEEIIQAREFFKCGTSDFFTQIKDASPLVREYGKQLVDRFMSFVVIRKDEEQSVTH